MAKTKKSTFHVLAEAMASDKLGDLPISKSHLDNRTLTIDEIKVLIREGFKDAKAVADVKAKEEPKGWGNAEVENQVDWAQALNLKEFFDLAEGGLPPWLDKKSDATAPDDNDKDSDDNDKDSDDEDLDEEY